jgi:hypothetical protein
MANPRAKPPDTRPNVVPPALHSRALVDLRFIRDTMAGEGQPLFAGPIRKFSLTFAPAILAGAVLTLVMIRSSSAEMFPGLWLLLYGVGLASALALTGPLAWGNVLLLAGFGGVHVVLDALIVRRHGG